MALEIRDDRQMRALTGVPTDKLEILETAFAKVFAEEKERIYQEQLEAGKRQRKLGGGQKGKLRTIREKLIFVLYYLKVYPTFDVLGTQFGMARSKACENSHFLYPILSKALVSLAACRRETFRPTFALF